MQTELFEFCIWSTGNRRSVKFSEYSQRLPRKWKLPRLLLPTHSHWRQLLKAESFISQWGEMQLPHWKLFLPLLTQIETWQDKLAPLWRLDASGCFASSHLFLIAAERHPPPRRSDVSSDGGWRQPERKGRGGRGGGASKVVVAQSQVWVGLFHQQIMSERPLSKVGELSLWQRQCQC